MEEGPSYYINIHYRTKRCLLCGEIIRYIGIPTDITICDECISILRRNLSPLNYVPGRVHMYVEDISYNIIGEIKQAGIPKDYACDYFFTMLSSVFKTLIIKNVIQSFSIDVPHNYIDNIDIESHIPWARREEGTGNNSYFAVEIRTSIGEAGEHYHTSVGEAGERYHNTNNYYVSSDTRHIKLPYFCVHKVDHVDKLLSHLNKSEEKNKLNIPDDLFEIKD